MSAVRDDARSGPRRLSGVRFGRHRPLPGFRSRVTGSQVDAVRWSGCDGQEPTLVAPARISGPPVPARRSAARRYGWDRPSTAVRACQRCPRRVGGPYRGGRRRGDVGTAPGTIVTVPAGRPVSHPGNGMIYVSTIVKIPRTAVIPDYARVVPGSKTGFPRSGTGASPTGAVEGRGTRRCVPVPGIQAGGRGVRLGGCLPSGGAGDYRPELSGTIKKSLAIEGRTDFERARSTGPRDASDGIESHERHH